MNRLNNNFYALLLSATVAVSPCAYGTEGNLKDDVVCSVRSGWKKYSTHIAVAAATTVIVAYSVAVYMNKISSPVALWKVSVLPLIITSKNRFARDTQKNGDKKVVNDVDGKNDDITVVVLDNHDDVFQVETSKDTQNGVKKLYRAIENGLHGITEKSVNVIEKMEVDGGEGYLG